MKNEKIKRDGMKIEQRLQNMKNFYLNTEKSLNKFSDIIPDKMMKVIKDNILGDEELKKIMESIDSKRPPRIFLIGRTGVGKSSLINAICGKYVASVSDVKSCTSGATIYEYKVDGVVRMEILDSRGIAESESLDEKISAENMLIDQINEFSPDVAILTLSCTHRDDINSDVEFLKKLSKNYSDTHKLKLPIVVVLNKSDEMAPARLKNPEEYNEMKISKINEAVKYYKGIIINNGLKIDNIIAVSSLIEWQTQDGIEVDVDNIEFLTNNDIDNLQMLFDGRYKIDELIDVLLEAILDYDAQMGLRMAASIDELLKRFTKKIIGIFSTIAGTLAITPIPFSDIYALLVIQATLVSLISILSGRELSIESAIEFILSLGGVAGAGYSFKLVAQQLSKFINVVYPGAGSVVSSIVAVGGTRGIGEAAVLYYIEGKTIEEAKKKLKNNKND